MQLTPEERRRVDQRIEALEAHTGAQAVTAIIGKSDNYPEIPWKAFALGASATALIRLVLDLVRPDWHGGYGTLFDAVVILGAGAALALLTMRVHSFARMFLHAARAETEVFQHAQALFLHNELFATPSRNGVLILVSLFERRVVILPDRALHAQIGDVELRPIIATMTPLLAAGDACDALCAGVAGVEALLTARGFRASGRAEPGLPDVVIEESGGDARA